MCSGLGDTRVLPVCDVFTHCCNPVSFIFYFLFFFQMKFFRSFSFTTQHFGNKGDVRNCFDCSHKARICAEAAWPCLGAGPGGQERPQPIVSRAFPSQKSWYHRKMMFHGSGGQPLPAYWDLTGGQPPPAHLLMPR